VLVEVLNGSGRAGAAASAAAALHADGFLINGTGNAASFTNPVTLVLYPPGMAPAAQTLAQWVKGASQLEESSSVPAGVVHLVLGYSFAGVVSSGGGS
jgi:hypothetical protein